jgi:hypothetical protein
MNAVPNRVSALSSSPLIVRLVVSIVTVRAPVPASSTVSALEQREPAHHL